MLTRARLMKGMMVSEEEEGLDRLVEGIEQL